MLAVDHVLIGTDDLDLAAVAIEARYGLASVAGGRHPAWGTANRIVPLGDTYLELVAVADPEIAAGTPFGRRVAAAPSGQPIGWAVRTDSIEAVGRRLGLPVVSGSRAAPGGTLLTWSSVGVDVAMGESGLPFFIQWGAQTPFPGATRIRHPAGSGRLKRISLTGDPERLADWLGDHELPIAVEAGPPRLSEVVLSIAGRDLALQAGPSAFRATPG